ncbi:DEAD/DEAH box helicase [Streptomyces noursei]|uniref:DEAD/DEAH box helicase n=1 Tax=Streptomyces noursei TaxID=1971 RepID=UPI001672DA8C|nr:DEAD/DEAH box helicase [Streptomyces noursei]MCZ1014846.1 DEAD/DEAH box helicase [Streptomyces noursei]GGX48085.1 helicase [Streptomyces noursei]
MRPTLAAQQLRNTTVEYLTTTFALAEPDTQDALTNFLTDPADGIFRGPYLRIRRPFRPASDGWEQYLDWWETGFRPYAHQAEAFARLSSKDGRTPQPTLVTTGTGSGKTESFLVPVVDHCRREKAAGKHGVKAVLLYPMNALAGDQASRLGDLLEDARLAEVTAGLYIGEASASGAESPYGRVMVERAEMRRNPPDILITNYKMLDLLIQRQQDASLWRDADLAYVVIDEFHTYDGAQGTDVAMLLRRLAVAVGADEPGRPLGRICPVATSATLGSAGGGDLTPEDAGPRPMLDVASQVFGVRFADEAVVGEDRLPVESFLAPVDRSLPVPTPAELAELPDPAREKDALALTARAVVGSADCDPRELGRRLLAHPLTHALLRADVHGPVSALEALAAFEPTSAWRLAAVSDPAEAETALARFAALLSVARDPYAPEGKDRPLLLIETHLWVRSLSRVLRFTAPEPVFSWTDADQAALSGATAPVAGAATPADLANVAIAAQVERRTWAQRSGRLPAAYCRHCGRSGWAAVCPERDPLQLEHAPDEIYRRSASDGAAKGRVRALIAATPAEAAEQARLQRGRRTRRGRRGTSGQASVMVLGDNGRELRALDPEEVLLEGGKVAEAPENGVYVTAWMHNREQDEFARQDRCPACGQSQGIRFLGAGVAPLTSVVVTQLFTGGELPAKDEKGRDRRRTLIFNDSVQDAAHRAGFVASRAWKFSLRSLLFEQLDQRAAEHPGEATDGVPLNELIADLVVRAADEEEKLLSSVVPPDMHDVDRVKKLLAGSKRAGEPSWSLVGERLAFNTLMEFGLSSRWGRTLELTRTIAAEVHLPDPERAARTAAALYEKQLNAMLPTADAEPDAADEAEGGESPVPAQQDALPASGPERLRRFEGYIRVLLEHIRAGGGIYHSWLDSFVDDEGRNRYLLTGLRPEGMPAFRRGTQAPAFVLVGARSGRTDFERADSAESWFTDYTLRCLGGLDRTSAAAFVASLLPRLADPEIGALAHRPTGEAKRGKQRGPGVYGLTAGHVRVRPLGDTETPHAAVTCPDCGWTQTVVPERTAVWEGLRCPLKQCDGRLTVPSSSAAGRAGRDYRYDYYRRLYRESGPYNVVAAEHTGVLKRKEREAVEKGFRRGTLHTDPNVLSCTPTLELGIDIGQLEAVILASLPSTTASYVQRVGRAGRATGNALMVSLADSSPRALYHLSEPRHLIDGPVTPPGCFLSAGELLRRQYTAYLIDLAARGRLRDVPPLVDRANYLFGHGGWTKALKRAATGRTDLAEQFLALFPEIDSVRDSGVSAEARQSLLEYAKSGLAKALTEAEVAWEAERENLLARRKQINAAAESLHDNIEDEARDKKALGREAAALGDRMQEISNTSAQTFLVEQGLLPNYSLVEEGVRLEATLNHKRPPRRTRGSDAETAAPRAQWRPEVRTYDRPATAALSELAPGNSYYVRGYQHRIDGFDLGPVGTPAEGKKDGVPAVLHTWRVCGECGYVRTGDDAEHNTGPCPRCAGTSIGGRTALYTVVVPRKVLSRDKRDDARIIDDHDNRTRINYTTVTAVDIPPESVKESWRHTRATFGVDHVREAVIRRFNLGRARPGRRADATFAGTETTVTGFVLCPLCGGATDREPGHDPVQEELSESALNSPEHAHHFPWCVVRRRDRRTAPRDLTRVLTAAEHRTEALRILLPAATLRVPERLASFSAALHLGLALHYGGDPAHIRSTPATEPDRDTELTRHYLVLYDALPGGTGYLQRLVDNDGEDFRAVLAAAQRVLRSCRCQHTPGRRACHRCLLPFAQTQREYKDLDRQEALWMLDGLLGDDGHSGWHIDRRPSRTASADDSAGDRVRFAEQAESDLERRFIECLDRWLARPGNGGAEHGTTPTGRQGKQFTLGTPEGRSVHWEVVAQKDLTGYRTRPDLLFRPASGAPNGAAPQPLSVAVYLDGYRWHASARTNRIASDAAKRARLRADGTLVWQITWDDVMAWEKQLTEDADGNTARRGAPAAAPDALAPVIAGQAADAAWPPYPVEGDQSPGGKVRAKWAAAKRNPAVLDSYLYSGAIPSLLGYLRHPNLALWRDLSVRALTGLLAADPKPVAVTADPESAVPWFEAVLREQTPPQPSGQGLTLIPARDGSGLPLLLAVDRRPGQQQTWSALAVLDDRPDAVRGDRPDHRRRWKAWLNWGNLVQFLDPTGSGQADGIALARTAVDDFDASLLAVTTGPATGLLSALREEKSGHGLSGVEDADETPAVTVSPPQAEAAQNPASKADRDEPEHMAPVELSAWRLVQEDLDDGDPAVQEFTERLIAKYAVKYPRLPVAEVLWDVDGVTMAIELAWPDHKIGVVLPAVVENEDDMAQFARQGWDVRPVDQWSMDELARRLLGSTVDRQEGDT